ncbi:MAG: zinc ribbon domain-containing protein [Nitrososphaerota archaeon]
MAVRYCPKCGLIISEPEANYCPNCGYDLRRVADSSERIYCMRCGKESSSTYRFCPNCGYPLIRLKRPRPLEPLERPASIAAASIMCFVFGALDLLLVIPAIIFAGIIEAAVAQGFRQMPGLEALQIPIQMIGSFLMILGILSLIFGVLYIIAGYFLWQSRRTGGYMAIILSIIGILSSIATWWIMPIAQAFSIGLDLIVILLVAIGWAHLR